MGWNEKSSKQRDTRFHIFHTRSLLNWFRALPSCPDGAQEMHHIRIGKENIHSIFALRMNTNPTRPDQTEWGTRMICLGRSFGIYHIAIHIWGDKTISFISRTQNPIHGFIFNLGFMPLLIFGFCGDATIRRITSRSMWDMWNVCAVCCAVVMIAMKQWGNNCNSAAIDRVR